jgi:CHAT domain-containing protein
LRNQNKFLVEDKKISYVGSGRDVVSQISASKKAVTASFVIGNPDFDFDINAKHPVRVPIAGSGISVAATRVLSRSFQGEKFQPLPKSAEEARSVAKTLGSDSVLRLGATAREIELKSIESPRVLHIATHGFFLPDQEMGQESSGPGRLLFRGSHAMLSSNGWESPLIRCGIALAGANLAQQTTNLVEDGLLTGQEAALLNLQGTELVILSACNTGSGELKIGEGVMSLRRAFRIAGAETVLASYWPVSELSTPLLMEEFIRRWRAGEPRVQAWREAQLSLLHSRDFSNPYFWAGFTLMGQWQ